MATFYFCNGENPACYAHDFCQRNGGRCKQTTNINYAITPECKDPWKHPERFEVTTVPGYEAYYFEREEQDSNDAEVKEIETDDED